MINKSLSVSRGINLSINQSILSESDLLRPPVHRHLHLLLPASAVSSFRSGCHPRSCCGISCRYRHLPRRTPAGAVSVVDAVDHRRHRRRRSAPVATPTGRRTPDDRRSNFGSRFRYSHRQSSEESTSGCRRVRTTESRSVR